LGSTTATLAVHRQVACENCGGEYAFIDEKKATHTIHSFFTLDNKGSAKLAKEDAENDVNRQVTDEIAAVPCPQCGWYQRAMFRAARKVRHQRVLRIAKFLRWYCMFIAIGLMFLIPLFAELLNIRQRNRQDLIIGLFFLGTIGSFFLGILLPILRWLVVKTYDPNRAIPEDERKAIGKRLSLT
jgi:hypothetical protein